MITDKENAPHYFWGEKCDNWVLADTDGLSVKYESMPYGTKEKLHYHLNAQQYFFILKGSATFYIEDQKVVLSQQQGLLINPGMKHFIANETDQKLDFLVISQPSTNNDRIIINDNEQ
ncbi:cupin domain-containing protein [Pedobacter borealis]|uniref:cupin domain-containing protein n=1 Tax=Pedobacter borealis TaxID=475254 RepID=UPI0004932783|nr:cupin domain-containing protein [Pedobacter borealis]